MDCSLPGPSVHGIFQARVLEWGASAFSEGPLRLVLIGIIKGKIKGLDQVYYISFYFSVYSSY